MLENSLFEKKLEFKTMIYILQQENLELIHHNQTNKTLKNSHEINPTESSENHSNISNFAKHDFHQLSIRIKHKKVDANKSTWL